MLRAVSAAPAPVTAILLSFLCPTEFSLYFEGLRLPPHRLALLLLFPFALLKLAGGAARLRGFDIAFAAYAMWTLGVYTLHGEGQEGLVYGGSLALESLGAYVVARAYVRDLAAFRATLAAGALAIGAAALVALPETLLGQTYAHDLLRQLTGYEHPTAVETRLGLTRAYGTFDHPIHYGTFCAAMLATFWFAERRSGPRWRRAGLLGGATVLGLSSAPLLCLALQAGMIAWDRLTRRLPSRTMLTLAVLAGLYIGASLVATRSPVAILATGLTLDSWTGYYRLQIWEHGLENVWANPWTGIGLADWERPSWMVSPTIDAFWLVVAMRAGLPAVLLLALAIVSIGWAALRRRARDPSPEVRRIATGWAMSLIALGLIGCTVHYWNVLHAYFFFFLGLAGWIADPTRTVASLRATASAPAPPAPLRLGTPYAAMRPIRL